MFCYVEVAIAKCHCSAFKYNIFNKTIVDQCDFNTLGIKSTIWWCKETNQMTMNLF